MIKFVGIEDEDADPESACVCVCAGERAREWAHDRISRIQCKQKLRFGASTYPERQHGIPFRLFTKDVSAIQAARSVQKIYSSSIFCFFLLFTFASIKPRIASA